METFLDHAVVVVDELPAAARAFRDAGFIVVPGGRHDALPTENAIVSFADGSYLELLACREPAVRTELRALASSERWAGHLKGVSAIARRFLPRLARADGVGDAVIGARQLARFAAESRRREVVMTGPVPMRRERTDAEALAWELVLPEDDALPFLIEDRTPRAWRVPADAAATAHANGARGLAAVHVRTSDPAALALRLADLFDASLAARPDGASRAVFARAAWWLEAGEPAGAYAVRVRGVAALPPAIVALGVLPARPEDDA